MKPENLNFTQPTILIVDDETNIRSSLRRFLEDEGYGVLEAKGGKETLEILKETNINLILMDVKMAGISGLEALQEIKKINPKQILIIMTAFGTTQTAIEAMKFGAFDYILKPFDMTKLKESIEQALKINKMIQNQVTYSIQDYTSPATDYIIGNSYKMQSVYKLIGQVAEEDITVLLRGESGTGKELVARAIYHNSLRKNKTYLAVNCAAIPETLLESELFGHEKGAFTDAQSKRIGKFEQCSGGTIFLDEIGDMSLPTQAKLLRVLQEKEITRIGSNELVKVDVRLIVATNKNLEEAIKEKKFREDLYYRLNVVTINLPPLRERKEDIPELVHYFLARFKAEFKKNILGINQEALEKLIHYDWPGNIRELENILKRAYVLGKGSFILPQEIFLPTEEGTKKEMAFDSVVNLIYNQLLNSSEKEKYSLLELIEKEFIKKALQESQGNQLKAAEILGINRNTLHLKINKYGLK